MALYCGPFEISSSCTPTKTPHTSSSNLRRRLGSPRSLRTMNTGSGGMLPSQRRAELSRLPSARRAEISRQYFDNRRVRACVRSIVDRQKEHRPREALFAKKSKLVGEGRGSGSQKVSCVVGACVSLRATGKRQRVAEYGRAN